MRAALVAGARSRSWSQRRALSSRSGGSSPVTSSSSRSAGLLARLAQGPGRALVGLARGLRGSGKLGGPGFAQHRSPQARIRGGRPGQADRRRRPCACGRARGARTAAPRRARAPAARRRSRRAPPRSSPAPHRSRRARARAPRQHGCSNAAAYPGLPLDAAERGRKPRARSPLALQRVERLGKLGRDLLGMHHQLPPRRRALPPRRAPASSTRKLLQRMARDSRHWRASRRFRARAAPASPRRTAKPHRRATSSASAPSPANASSRSRWPLGSISARSSCWPWISTSALPTWRNSCTLTRVSLMKARVRPSADWHAAQDQRRSASEPFSASSRNTGWSAARSNVAVTWPCARALAARAQHRRGRRGKREGIEQDRFAGAGLAGEHGKGPARNSRSSRSIRTMSRIDKAASMICAQVGLPSPFQVLVIHDPSCACGLEPCFCSIVKE